MEETNPREQNLKSKVAKEIKHSLLNVDGYFHLLNRGITVSVASAEKEEEDLKSSEKAFRDLVASYLFISDNVTTPNHP